jgi:hypothetical protein
MESLRVLLAIAAVEDLEIHQMDVVTAYLAGELEEEIYMAPPQGLSGADNKVCPERYSTVTSTAGTIDKQIC